MKKFVLASLALVLSTSAAYAQSETEPKIYNTPPTYNTKPAARPAVPSTNVTKEQIQEAQKLYNSMTPQQRAAVADQIGKQAGTISPQQKAAIISRAREHYQSLSPQEKVQLKKQLLELGARLPANEREAYLKKLDPIP